MSNKRIKDLLCLLVDEIFPLVVEKEEEEENEEKEEKEEEEQIEDLVWKDNWNNPRREMTRARTPDIYDDKTNFRGNGKCVIEYGIMRLSGSQPRLYVNLDLQDVEVEVEYKRVGNDGKGWSGGTIGVRSDVEGHSKSPHLAHTYYLRLKHEGKVDIYRELQHSSSGRAQIKYVKYEWESGKWYKMKFRCFNKNNRVHLEGYINDELVIEHTDDNYIMLSARGVVFIRNTDVDEAMYRNFTIKSINEDEGGVKEEHKNNQMTVVYCPYWKPSVDVSKYDRITMAFLDLTYDGDIMWDKVDKMDYEHHYKGVSIGGWNDSKKAIKILTEHKDKVISKLVMEAHIRGYKYINYDLEYPPTNQWIKGILNTTKEEINRRGYDMKISVAAGAWEGHLKLFDGCSKYVDWIEIMAYDDDTSKLVYFTKKALEICLEMGYPKEKVFMGISWDNNGDIKETAEFKKKYVKEKGLGGIMIWESTLI